MSSVNESFTQNSYYFFRLLRNFWLNCLIDTTVLKLDNEFLTYSSKNRIQLTESLAQLEIIMSSFTKF